MAEVLADLVGRLSFDADDKGVKQFARGVDDLAKASDTATARGVALGTFMGNLATKALDLAVSVGKAAYATGKDLVVGFAEAGTEIDRMAKRTDLGVVALQRFTAAGRKAGLEPEVVAKSVQVLNKNLADLALTGGGPAKDALGLLGVKFSELEGLDTDERLGLIADALRDVPDAGERANITMRLFGEEAGALAPILAQGREGLDAIGDAAERAGLVLDEHAVESAKRTKKALGDIDKTTTALGNTIAVALAPTVADLAERFGEWYRANEEVIAQRVPEVIDAIVESGAAAIEWATDFADDVVFLSGQIGYLAESIEDGLVSAYETAKPVIDGVSAVIEFQVGLLIKAVELIEEVVGRLDVVRDIVAEVSTGLGMDDTPTTSTRGSSGLAEENKARRQALGQAEPGQGVTVATMSASQLAGIASDLSQPEAVRRQARDGVRVAADREAAQNRRVIADATARAAKAQTDALEEAQRKAEADARRKRGAKYSAGLKAGAGGGGSKAVDTREAEALFGPELEALARAAGVGDKAIKAALEAAAKSLEGGASQTVARQAGVGQLESLSGANLSAAGGPDAALFGLLTQIGGPQAARSAADGARFVQVSNVFNSTFNYELRLPDGFGDGLRTDVDALAGSTARQIVEQWEQVIDRFGQGLEP